MKWFPRAAFTLEFKVVTVQQVQADKRAAEVARELGLIEKTLHY